MLNKGGEFFRRGTQINQVYCERDVGVLQQFSSDAKFPVYFLRSEHADVKIGDVVILVRRPGAEQIDLAVKA